MKTQTNNSDPCTGPCLQVASGKMFWPLDPRVGDFEIEVIAQALSRIPRFNGHTSVPYSVAEHCLNCITYLRFYRGITDKRILRSALMHDAAEAFIGDMSAPLKDIPEMGFFRRIEDSILTVMGTQFDFDAHLPGVMEADYFIRREEALVMMGMKITFPDIPLEPEFRLARWLYHAEDEFLRTWNALKT